MKHQTILTKTKRRGGQKEAAFWKVSGVFPKGILILAWGRARPKLLGQQGGVGTALTLRVSGAGVSYPGAGVW